MQELSETMEKNLASQRHLETVFQRKRQENLEREKLENERQQVYFVLFFGFKLLFLNIILIPRLTIYLLIAALWIIRLILIATRNAYRIEKFDVSTFFYIESNFFVYIFL